jgi:hypothetical protein
LRFALVELFRLPPVSLGIFVGVLMNLAFIAAQVESTHGRKQMLD